MRPAGRERRGRIARHGEGREAEASLAVAVPVVTTPQWVGLTGPGAVTTGGSTSETSNSIAAGRRRCPSRSRRGRAARTPLYSPMRRVNGAVGAAVRRRPRETDRSVGVGIELHVVDRLLDPHVVPPLALERTYRSRRSSRPRS